MKLFKVISIWLPGALAFSTGCGVRGVPQPPLIPPEIGRGQPTFKRATEGFAFPDVPPVGETSTDGKKSDDESEKE